MSHSKMFSRWSILFLSVIALALVSGCAVEQEKPEDPWVHVPAPTAPVFVPTPMPAPTLPSGESVDYNQLKTNLNMDIPQEKLGYKEKAFNSCQVASGFDSTKNCRSMVLVVLHYNLSCRYSEDTLSETLTASDIHAVANQQISWVLKNGSGISQTNEGGYAEIAQVYAKSPRGERIRLSTGTDFLYTRANELTSVVAPSSWCTY